MFAQQSEDVVPLKVRMIGVIPPSCSHHAFIWEISEVVLVVAYA
jgi:hypothetical protein